MTAQRKNKRRRLYTVQTATRLYGCMACGGSIQQGEQYTRRRYRSSRGYVTLRKCKRCVPVRETT